MIKMSMASKQKQFTVSMPVTGYRSLKIPGVPNAKLGVCFIKATDLPAVLDQFMEINPRVPSRTAKGLLTGPVAKGILETLHEAPADMVLKNQGIYLLVDRADFELLDPHASEGQLDLVLVDPGKHGIINGGHTYAAIRQAVEECGSADEFQSLEQAYIRLHIYTGVDEDFVPEIAEGLNRSKQVDDPSLLNLQGDFDRIRKVLKDVKGADSIAYHQGDAGSVYISEVLVYLEMFNVRRFADRKQPNSLYNRQGLGLKYFVEDLDKDAAFITALMKRLPDILWLVDSIRYYVPQASNRNQLKYGRIKIGQKRAGTPGLQKVWLPFIGKESQYRVPNGWVYPILSAFRANLIFEAGEFSWRVPLQQMLDDLLGDLVGVCVIEHRDNNMRPELIGKRESAYSQCHTLAQLYLARLK